MQCYFALLHYNIFNGPKKNCYFAWLHYNIFNRPKRIETSDSLFSGFGLNSEETKIHKIFKTQRPGSVCRFKSESKF